MREANRLWKLLRPETVVLVIIPTAALILEASLGMLDNRNFGADFWTSLVYLRFFGWQFFCAICLAAFGYLVFSAIAYVIQRRRFRRQTQAELAMEIDSSAWASLERFRAAKSLAWLAAAYAFAVSLQIVVMLALCLVDRQKVIWADEFLMRADHVIFGAFVPFEMHELRLFRLLATPMIFSYSNLGWVLSLVLIGLCVFQYARFRQFVLTSVLVTFFALPGWFALPAVDPSEAYRLNRLNTQIPFDIALETAAPIIHMHPDVVEILDLVEPYQSQPLHGFYFITSMPSLHVAWGMLAVWFGSALPARAVWILVPWGVLNALGAIFTLQHYAVDVPAGMVLAAIAVVFVRGLVVLETRCGFQPPKGYEIFGFIRKDAAQLMKMFLPPAQEEQSRGRNDVPGKEFQKKKSRKKKLSRTNNHGS